MASTQGVGRVGLLEVRREDGTIVTLRCVGSPEELLLAAGTPLPRWAVEAVEHGVLPVRLPDLPAFRMASVREITTGAPEVRARLRALWGSEFWDRHFVEPARLFALVMTPVPSDHGAADPVREEFDALAPTYEQRIGRQPFQLYQRRRALEILRATFPEPAHLLEFGPGPGTQTLPMLQAGHHVTVVDPSARMLEQLVRNAAEAGVEGGLTARLGRAGSIESLLADLPAGGFDGAFSLFGALNLEERIERVPDPLARLLRPGAPFLAGLTNRSAVLGGIWLVGAGHYRVALDRFRPSFEFAGFLHPLQVHPVTGRALTRLFAREFDLRSMETISVLAPPFPSARLERFWGEAGLHRLARLDRWLARSPALAWAADQVCVTLVRRPAGPPRGRESLPVPEERHPLDAFSSPSRSNG